MVYLCVQAWLWYDEAVKKVYDGKMSEDLYQNHKKYMLSKCPFKRKTEEKEKGVYTRMNCSMISCSQSILVGGICWTLKFRKLI